MSRTRIDGRPWKVWIKDPTAMAGAVYRLLELRHGALATSGDTHRFVLAHGTRYSHILNPRSGWPVPGAPRSVNAELVPHWVIRH